MGRILAVDYGTKRTGLAVTDPLRIIASPLETVPTQTVVDHIVKYCSGEPVDICVVGEPRRQDGTPSDTHQHVVGLVRRLEKALPGVKVVMFDERFTSVMAQRSILESGVGKMKRRDKAAVDMVSAAIILQGYMESMQYAAEGGGKE